MRPCNRRSTICSAEGVEGRGVLVRSDLNVPLDDDGNITDPGRIIARCRR